MFVKTLGLYPVVGLLTQPNKKPRAAPYNISLAVRSQADGREIVKVMDPDKIGIDVEKIMADVEKRGERTDRKARS